MKQYFGVDRALQEIASGEKIKLVSNDFKSHIFSKTKYGKPILHEVQKSVGKNIILHMDYNEFKEKYKNNEFYIYE